MQEPEINHPDFLRKLKPAGIAAAICIGAAIAFPAFAQQQQSELRGEVENIGVRPYLLNDTAMARRNSAFGSPETAVDGDEEQGEDGVPALPYPPTSTQAENDVQDDPAQSIFELNRTDTSSTRRLRRTPRETGDTANGDAEIRSALRGSSSASQEDSAEEFGSELTTGSTRAVSIEQGLDDPDSAAETNNPRASAIERGSTSEEENPFDPVGIRAGSFLLFPSLEQGLTWSSNADSSAGGSEALLSETTLRLVATSQWARHQAELEMFGTFRTTLSGYDVSEPSGGIEAGLRLDLIDGLIANADLSYEISREDATSPVIIPGIATEPLLHALSAELGIERTEAKLRFAATASIERRDFSDAELLGGGTLSQRDRNSTVGTFTLRGGYELSPAIVPFLETEIGRRIFDERVDAAGYARSADRYGIRAGVELDLGEKLTGEFSAGWISERPDDDRLSPVEGLSLSSALAWSPLRGTTVNLNTDTIIETTNEPGLSGSVLYSSNIAIEREIRANLTGNASFGVAYRDYSGSNGEDLIMDIEAGFTWWLNRYFGITGRSSYETVDSNLPGRDAEWASVFMGVRLRR